MHRCVNDGFLPRCLLKNRGIFGWKSRVFRFSTRSMCDNIGGHGISRRWIRVYTGVLENLHLSAITTSVKVSTRSCAPRRVGAETDVAPSLRPCLTGSRTEALASIFRQGLFSLFELLAVDFSLRIAFPENLQGGILPLFRGVRACA